MSVATSPIQNVLSRLTGVKPRGKGWSAICPAHDDHAPSLDIDEGDDGRVLLVCRAKCAQRDIIDALEMNAADLFVCGAVGGGNLPPPKRWAGGGVKHALHHAHPSKAGTIVPPAASVRPKGPKPAAKPKTIHPNRARAAAASGFMLKDFRIAAEYDYHDAAGGVAGVVVRWEGPGPKEFRQLRPVDGGWITSGPEVWPVYRLPAVLDTPLSTIVYIVEGEKDADRMKGEGLLATTTPMGAGNDAKCDLSALEGRHVVIIPDNDDKGREHADRIAGRLIDSAASVKVLHLDGLPDKGDVSDWFDAGHDAEELDRLAVHCGLATVTGSLASDASDDTPRRRLNVIAGGDVQCKSVTWFWPQRMPTGINLLLGMPDVGKSTVAANLAARVTNGTAWPTDDGYAPEGGVIWCAGESDLSMEVAPRLRANGANMDRVSFVRGAYRIGEGGSKERIAEEYEDAVDLGSDVPALREVAEAINAKLIVFDPLDAFIGAKVDIFKGPEIRRMLAPLKSWCEETGITALIIHHPRKAKSDHAIDAVSGGRSFGALPRSVWVAGWLGKTRYFAPVKTNLSRDKPATIEYATGNVPEYSAPLIRWGREAPDVTAEAILGGDTKSPAKDEAVTFLRDVVGDGAVWATDLQAEADAAGISWNTVKRSKADAGIETRQVAEPRQGWIYRRVGSDAVPPAPPCSTGDIDPTGSIGSRGSNGPSEPETALPFEALDPEDPLDHVSPGSTGGAQ